MYHLTDHLDAKPVCGSCYILLCLFELPASRWFDKSNFYLAEVTKLNIIWLHLPQLWSSTLHLQQRVIWKQNWCFWRWRVTHEAELGSKTALFVCPGLYELQDHSWSSCWLYHFAACGLRQRSHRVYLQNCRVRTWQKSMNHGENCILSTGIPWAAAAPIRLPTPTNQRILSCFSPNFTLFSNLR